MTTLQEIRDQERSNKTWSGTDHVDLLRNETFGRSVEDILGLERRNAQSSHTVELMKQLGDAYPIVVIDGKPFEIQVASLRGRDGFDRLIDHDDLYQLLLHRGQHVAIDGVPEKLDQLFNPLHAEGDGAGIVFGPSFQARVREGSSRGGTLSPGEIEEYLAKNPSAATSYNFVRLPFRPEIFSKVTRPGHLAESSDMYIVPRLHPVKGDVLANVPEPERVSYVTPGGTQVGEVVGIDSTGNGEEAISVNRLDNVKRYPGCATIAPRMLVIDPDLTHKNEVGHPMASFDVAMTIKRSGQLLWSGSYQSGETQRSDDELNRESRQTRGHWSDPFFQFRGTGAVPPPEFNLQAGDQVTVLCSGVGELNVTVRNVDFPADVRSIR